MKTVRRLGAANGRFGNPVSGLTVFVVLVAAVSQRCARKPTVAGTTSPDDDRAAPVTVRGLLGKLIEHAMSPGPADWPASAEAWKALS
ncbi:hypothetical protein OIE71_18350 [Streptomyces sp. NBC_01725]|uniref:hypothetical protein n=1 Tax=Streptomyces sp. NBC_01725 TaxID=2975923 RepID=UPI002E2B7140|nr:hypothetical protein [Streptomyces sp. NBC_01725]